MTGDAGRQKTTKTDCADVLYGALAIAEFLELREKQARHWIAFGYIPTFRIGGKICAQREELRSWLKSIPRGAVKSLPGGACAQI